MYIFIYLSTMKKHYANLSVEPLHLMALLSTYKPHNYKVSSVYVTRDGMIEPFELHVWIPGN